MQLEHFQNQNLTHSSILTLLTYTASYKLLKTTSHTFLAITHYLTHTFPTKQSAKFLTNKVMTSFEYIKHKTLLDKTPYPKHPAQKLPFKTNTLILSL